MVRESGLDWTIAQPAGLTDGIRTGRYQAAERLALSGVPKISRADVAHFLLAQIEDRTNIGKTLVLAYQSGPAGRPGRGRSLSSSPRGRRLPATRAQHGARASSCQPA